MKSKYIEDRIFNLINEEIDLRGTVDKNGKVTYEYGPSHSTITFAIEKARTNWQILKEEYSYAYRWFVDTIFDEIHPY